MLVDSDLDWARAYQGAQVDPADFDEFWATTLAESSAFPLNVRVVRVATPLSLIDVYDVTFAGAGGTDVRAWLRVPAGTTTPLPTIVSYVGYGGGRGKPEENLVWASAGFAHLQMDTRGQGSSWSVGDTADDAAATPQVPGVMTKGITSRETYYYRRLFIDAVRAVDAAKTLPQVDAAAVSVVGGSQGGGIALAVSGLRNDIVATVAFVPFLCDFPRSTRVTDAYPYREIADYLRIRRGSAEAVHTVLSYFDGINFARRAQAPAHFSVALMDEICPTSTVYAAYNAYAGAKEIVEWPYNGHEAGGIDDELGAVEFIRSVLAQVGR